MAALHQATIQVLTREGLARCTTTRIAARAGMSVGSLYQYYPNRDALLSAVLTRHLEEVAEAIERVCMACRGQSVADMAEALVRAFFAIKFRDPEQSRALYAVADERGGRGLRSPVQARGQVALAAMLTTAPDVRFDDVELSALAAFSVMVAPMQSLLLTDVSTERRDQMEGETIRVLCAYFQTFRRGGADASHI